MVRIWMLVVWMALFGALGCGPSPDEYAPSEALRAFLTALDRSTHAPEQLRAAYGWIDEESQALLAQRASLAASLAGRKLAPWDMLVPGRGSFSAYSVPSLRMRTRTEGERAFVALRVDGRGEVEIPMVRQGGRWRVQLDLTDKPRK